MRIFRNLKLRDKLIGFFLLCAMITAATAAVGIISLRSVGGALGQMAGGINGSIEKQNAELSQSVGEKIATHLDHQVEGSVKVAELRTLLDGVESARDLESLDARARDLSDFRTGWPDGLRSEAVDLAADRLVPLKRTELTHVAEGATVFGEVTQALDDINAIAGMIADDAEFAVLMLEDSASQLATGSAEDLESGVSELLATTGDIIAQVSRAQRIKYIAMALQAGSREILVAHDPALVDTRLRETRTYLGELKSQVAELESGENRDQLGTLAEGLDALADRAASSRKEQLQTQVDMASLLGHGIEDQGSLSAALRILDESQIQEARRMEEGINGSISESMDAQQASLKSSASSAIDAGAARIKKWQGFMLGLCGGAFVLAVGIGLFATRQIASPIRSAVEMAAVIGKGDTSVRLNLNSGDEIGQLGQAMDSMAENLQLKANLANAIAGGDLTREVPLASESDVLGLGLRDMVTRLRDLIRQVQSAALVVGDGSSQIATSSQTLSDSATNQAGSLQEINSTVTEIADQSRQNAEDSKTALKLAQDAVTSARGGQARILEMGQAMDGISAASEEVEKVIKVIDDIAFQTNLLALNAAVEAARAGKHGKGFAVVAEEVRTLAGRSAEAARETSELIENSLEKVDEGQEYANSTRDDLANIVASAEKTTVLIQGIAEASEKQASGVAQVDQGIAQINGTTQASSANAEELASSAGEMAFEAKNLQEILSHFHLPDSRDLEKDDPVDIEEFEPELELV